MKPKYKIKVKKKEVSKKEWVEDHEYTRIGAAETRSRNLLREPGKNGFPKWDKVAIVFEQPVSKYLEPQKDISG